MRDFVKIPMGSDIKINVHIEPIMGLSMQDFDFFVEFFCHANKVVKTEKSQCIREDADNYRITFNARDVGVGVVKYRITAFIPDGDFDDGVRTEVVEGRMDIAVTSEL